MALTTKANLQQRDPNTVTIYAENDAAITQAIADASAMVRSKVTIPYTDASYDALDDTTIPNGLKFHLESLCLFILAAGKSGTVPDSIVLTNEKAEQYLRDVVAGKDSVPGLTLRSTGATGTSGAGRVAYGSRTRTFDEDDNDEYEIRKPGILS